MATFTSTWLRRTNYCFPARSIRLTFQAWKATSACSPTTRHWSRSFAPASLTVKVGADAQRIVIFGGFAEVSPQGLTVLADYATSLEDLDLAMLAARIAETEEKIKRIEVGSLLDRELERLDHFKAVDTHLQSTGMH